MRSLGTTSAAREPLDVVQAQQLLELRLELGHDFDAEVRTCVCDTCDLSVHVDLSLTRSAAVSSEARRRARAAVAVDARAPRRRVAAVVAQYDRGGVLHACVCSRLIVMILIGV
jgi:hypothetical protein